MSKQPIRVTVGLPAYGYVPALCVLSFGSFIAHGVGQGFIHYLANCTGAYIDRARNNVCKMALENGSTHLMFVDQDMILPEMALARLLGHRRPVVGGLYFGKDDAFTPVALHGDRLERVYELDVLPRLRTRAMLPDDLTCPCDHAANHLHQVHTIGMGCTLIETRFLRKMKKRYGDENWFSSRDTGEDVHFGTRCQEMGVPVALDGFINCGHVRDQLITRQHYEWAKTQQQEAAIPA